ncbi:carbohydrate kinase family protein [Lacrimispora saccharolytica]|uniref:PfkB domain protein n=1 Tax=Lacrimispora saccharolytica (strain ATCC 35040 / DSM 2544 / NRCC 2533 / WM1) TaxID=610130 RepID=D9R3I9_LACSW|nr:carbohydrate kinase family protein [Lacrimispora saccharolytica]ADL06710.1 PfkB domain protein [[Clostridium] saccharolyticum WM1]QRV19222.1 carbohydrate kinase family protein [Lacrimispora saccharolytica]
MKEIDVLIAGTPNIDLIVPPYDALPGPGEEIRVDNIYVLCGGGVAITSIGLSKLGMKTMIYGAVHHDLFGEFILQEMQKYGVKVKTRRSEKSTGISIALDVDKDRRFITYDGCVNEVTPKDIPKGLLEKTRHTHLTNYRGRIDLEEYLQFIEDAHGAGATVSMDVGWDDTGCWDECLFEITKKLDVFFINDKELMEYTRASTLDAGIEKLSGYCSHAAIKMGARGSRLLKDGESVYGRAYCVNSLDTTGAGDSFNAGYLYGFLNGLSPEECLKAANFCGASSVQGYGGYVNVPNLKQLKEELK